VSRIDDSAALPGLKIYPGLRVTLTFDLLILKVDRFMPLPGGRFVPICIELGSFVFKESRSQVW